MKECRCCKVNKLEGEFYSRPSNSDGLYSYCKECTSLKSKVTRSKHIEMRLKKAKEYREKDPEAWLQSAKDYYWKNREKVLRKRVEYREKNKDKISLREALKRISDSERFEKNKERHYIWSLENRDRINEWQRQWYQKNKEKRRAHVVLNRAIEAGKIMRPNKCSECNKECKPDGHHTDYSLPLDVIWICRACHSRKSPRTVLK